jgi:hypothetical protein
VVQEVLEPVSGMWPDEKCMPPVMKPTEGHVGPGKGDTIL